MNFVIFLGIIVNECYASLMEQVVRDYYECRRRASYNRYDNVYNYKGNAGQTFPTLSSKPCLIFKGLE